MRPGYILLGWSEVGELLVKREPHFTVVDPEGRGGTHTLRGNPQDKEVLKRAGVEQAAVVIILEKASSVFPMVKELNPLALVLVCGGDRKGGEYVVPGSEAVAEECLSRVKAYEKKKKKEALGEVLRSGKTMAILMHDNPDPDSISSALALKKVGETQGVESDLLYGGKIGYLENWVLVELLDVDLLSEVKPDFTKYDLKAFVDHSPWDYTSIGKEVNPDIVIDHHIPSPYRGTFMDVRDNVGSTSTILTEYLQLFDVEIDSKLATALFYALLVDTHSFRRGMSEDDIEALRVLRKKVDPEMLSQVERARYSRAVKKTHGDIDFLNVLGDAVKNMWEKGDVLFSFVGKVTYRDAVSSSSDYLLKMERARVVLVYGVVGDVLYISARSWDERLHIGRLLREAYADLGRAGGHPLIGGASIPLEKLPEDFEEEISERFLKVLHS